MAGLAGSVQVVGGSSLLKLHQVLSHHSHPSHLHGICILAPMLLAGWSCYPPWNDTSDTSLRRYHSPISRQWFLQNTPNRPKTHKWKGDLKVLCIFTETLGPLKIDLSFVTSSGSSAPVVLLRRHPSTLASQGSFPLRNGASGHGGRVAAVALQHVGHLVARKDQLSFRNICVM